jgi:UDPglucose 6-dehydrogenase
VKVSLATGRLSFSTNFPAAILASEIIFISVGTPSRENGEVDLSQVVQVAQEIAQHIDAYKVVVIKSTVPVGTAELVQSILGQEKREGEDFDIVANPEFLMEGRGLQDFHFPDRIIIGTSSEKARGILYELYEPVIQGVASGSAQKSGDGSRSTPIPVIETSVAAAQMIKYASNAFLATRVSFINEIAGICERVNTNIQDVVRGMGFDSRIGHSYF